MNDTPDSPITALTVPSTEAVAAPPVEFTAENADEMARCQNGLIDWAKSKLASTEHEAGELKAAYDKAILMKWAAGTLKRHAELAAKRVHFYSKILTALEHGYQIVPSFPITAFAIRTDKKKPLKMVSTAYYTPHTQEPQALPAEEGDYKNPFPLVMERQLAPATATTSEKKEYWADNWKELEFPISMAKPKIMEATSRAMALKIFDDIGILPGFASNERNRPPKGDPMIIARVKEPKANGPFLAPRFVSFIVAWHIDTRTL